MESSEQRIKIAVQKTGRLTEHSQELLERCGLKLTKSKDRLVLLWRKHADRSPVAGPRRRHSGACQRRRLRPGNRRG